MIKKYLLHCRPGEQVETEISICKNLLQIFQFYKSGFFSSCIIRGKRLYQICQRKPLSTQRLIKIYSLTVWYIPTGIGSTKTLMSLAFWHTYPCSFNLLQLTIHELFSGVFLYTLIKCAFLLVTEWVFIWRCWCKSYRIWRQQTTLRYVPAETNGFIIPAGWGKSIPTSNRSDTCR